MILVTGASGTINTQLVKHLDAQGERVRVLARDPKKAATAKNVEAVQADLSRPETLDEAFKGVSTVFVVTNASPDAVRLEKNAFDAAKKHNVKHVVLLSAAGADLNSPITLARWHAESESNLKSSGLSYSILQPTFFMQNNFASADSIKREGRLYGSFKQGRIPMIDVVDIAATAAAILTKPQAHNGQTYYLTGPEPLTHDQVAEKIGKAIGKTVVYVDIPSTALVQNLKGFGMPDWLAEDFGKMEDFFATDQAASPVDTVEKIAGRKPRTFDAFLSDNAAVFK